MNWNLGILGAALLIGACATPYGKERLITDGLLEHTGVFVSGEYAHFKTENDQVYALRIERDEDQKLLAKLAPLRVDGASTCVRMTLRGRLDRTPAFLNRKQFSVTEIVRASEVPCNK